MDMQDKIIKKKMQLQKIINYTLCVILISFLVELIFDVPTFISNGITIITSSIFYGSMIIQYKYEKNKIHIGLCLLAITCLILLSLRLFITNDYLNLVGISTVYFYYIVARRLISGEFNKTLIIIASMVITSTALSIFFQNTIVNIIVAIVQCILILKILNPLFNKLADIKIDYLKSTNFSDDDAKKVPLIRKILFGRTGKLDLSLIKFMLGK